MCKLRSGLSVSFRVSQGSVSQQHCGWNSWQLEVWQQAQLEVLFLRHNFTDRRFALTVDLSNLSMWFFLSWSSWELSPSLFSKNTIFIYLSAPGSGCGVGSLCFPPGSANPGPCIGEPRISHWTTTEAPCLFTLRKHFAMFLFDVPSCQHHCHLPQCFGSLLLKISVTWTQVQGDWYLDSQSDNWEGY